MKHIKSFFESNNLESDIRDCFLPLSDYLNVNFGRQDGKLKVSINLDNRVTNGEEAISKFGVKYKPVVNGSVISDDIANAISHCLGLGANIEWCMVTWKNAGEWNMTGKEGMGPGLMSNVFKKEGRLTEPFDNPVSGKYSLDVLCDFISYKGDLLRHIKIIFY
jgi:hypothetical protein